MKLSKNWESTLSRIVAKTWIDEDFCKRFISEPTVVLREAGMALNDTARVIVNQGQANTSVLTTADGGITVYQINLPSKPENLTDEQMSAWAKDTMDTGSSYLGCSC
ncbi:MAG: hypothetical protein QNJ41_20605 [Xenococcaceae cyanobacterium MO_188.B32]|nr:hypothetical protein [Xenococcaceae cyanobacterium MO_188.B32]